MHARGGGGGGGGGSDDLAHDFINDRTVPVHACTEVLLLSRPLPPSGQVGCRLRVATRMQI